ncbi:MAG: hypothetical protein V1804_00325 [Patescibacteria group bacterium]
MKKIKERKKPGKRKRCTVCKKVIPLRIFVKNKGQCDECEKDRILTAVMGSKVVDICPGSGCPDCYDKC